MIAFDTLNANTAVLSRFSEGLRSTLRLIQNNRSCEVTFLLVLYVASFVHPDYEIDISLLDELPILAKQAALDFFEHCLSTGLTIEEQGALLAFVQPHIMSTLRGPVLH
jgi:hypothetical protein